MVACGFAVPVAAMPIWSLENYHKWMAMLQTQGWVKSHLPSWLVSIHWIPSSFLHFPTFSTFSSIFHFVGGSLPSIPLEIGDFGRFRAISDYFKDIFRNFLGFSVSYWWGQRQAAKHFRFFRDFWLNILGDFERFLIISRIFFGILLISVSFRWGFCQPAKNFAIFWDFWRFLEIFGDNWQFWAIFGHGIVGEREILGFFGILLGLFGICSQF